VPFLRSTQQYQSDMCTVAMTARATLYHRIVVLEHRGSLAPSDV